MKMNLTTVLLFGILGLVAFKLLSGGGFGLVPGAGGGSPNSNPGGTTPGSGEASPDTFTAIAGTVKSIFDTIGTISKSSQQSN